MANPRASTHLLVAAGLALAAGCSHLTPPEGAGDRNPDAREMCRRSFRACAPPASFAEETDVRRLDIRKLVHLSGRLDVDDDLAKKAADRVLKLATGADTEELLDMEAALDEVATWSERCRCAEFRSELEKRDVGSIVASRLPARETRTPEHWVDGILSRIETLRSLRRSAAKLIGAGDESAASQEAAAKAAAARRDLCETVHSARAPLPPDSFRSMLDAVYKKERARAGDGSAEVAKRMLDEFKDSSDCGAAAEQ